MRPDNDNIEKTLERSFPSASTEQMESARERIYESLRSDSAPLSVRPVKDVPSRMSRFSRQRTPARIAACFVAAFLVSAVFYRTVLSPDDVYAIVETTDGSVVQISQGRTLIANVGDKIAVDTPVRTGSGAEAKLKLPDGSRIEMQPESELSWQRADDSLHIQLKQGSVNVTPAEEAVGKLYVQNREQLVPVMGAIFQSAAAPIQSPAIPKWEAVSVRPCENTGGGGEGRGGGGTGGGGTGRGAPQNQFDPERMVLSCRYVMELVMSAYLANAPEVPAKDRGAAGWAIHTVPIEGGPSWMNSERYTIEAKAEKPVDGDTMRGPMLQTLLEDRFKLKLRRESREVPLLALTVAKGGPKMKPHQEGSCTPRPPRGGGPRGASPAGVVFCKSFGGDGPSPTSRRRTFEAEGLTIEQFVRIFTIAVVYETGKPVIDKTGLTGKFDFKVEYGFSPQEIKDNAQRTGRSESDFDAGPTFFDAIQDQLGLKLEQTKGPWEHLVIDHVERPSPN